MRIIAALMALVILCGFVQVPVAHAEMQEIRKPDLAFDPSQPLGWSKCQGPYANIWNTGDADIGRKTEARFLIRLSPLGSKGPKVFEREVEIPPLRAGEGYRLYAGELFWGVPGHQYTLEVVLDPWDNVDEQDELNNIERITFAYQRADLPTFDLEVKDLELEDSTLRFRVKHTGCIDSPPVTAHLEVEYPPQEFASAWTEELATLDVPQLSGIREETFEFPNIDQYSEKFRWAARLCVRVDVAEVSREVEGVTVTVSENPNNNRVCLALSGLIIEGPNRYFLERKYLGDDVAVFRPSDLLWYYDFDLNGTTDDKIGPWGKLGDLPIAGDFDRDGSRDDVAVFRPSEHKCFFDFDHDGNTDDKISPWANPGDLPIAGDFDRDGFEDDVAVFRPSNGLWYYDIDHDGDTDYIRGPWGREGDIPISGEFSLFGAIQPRSDDVAVFRPSTGMWYYDVDHDGDTDYIRGPWGKEGDIPLAGDFDRDGIPDDVAVFRPSEHKWFFDFDHDGCGTDLKLDYWGNPGDLPIAGDFKHEDAPVYAISNPEDIWPVAGGTPPYTITYELECDGARASYDPSTSELTLTIPRSCHQQGLKLKITATDSLGVMATKEVELYFYLIDEPPKSRLIGTCIPTKCLASKPFGFVDDPIAIQIYPGALLQSVTHTHATGQFTDEEAEIDIEIEWKRPNGDPASYHPRDITKSSDDPLGPGYINFTIPHDEVFEPGMGKAVEITITLNLHLGSGQSISRTYSNVWLHDGTLPVYLRSFNFGNTRAPYISWQMWEDFWGEDAVNDCIGRDMASEALFEVFKEMCSVGRCFAYALVGQKFHEYRCYEIGLGREECEKRVDAIGKCEWASPEPFALPLDAKVYTGEICEATGDPCLREADRYKKVMFLDTYITYQYMWALDEHHLRRGVEKLERYFNGEDIVLETLNELRAWQNLPEEERWQNPYIIQMLPPNMDEIRNAHAVLAYRVEEISPDEAWVWIVDSNRPFQPNGAENQDESYIRFYRGTDGRWNFEYKFPDGGKLRDFLFASPTSMFHGETSAVTESDVLSELWTIIELYRHMGATSQSSASSGSPSAGPALYLVGSGAKLVQVEDEQGGKLFTPTGRFETDPTKRSYKIAPLPIPSSNPPFIAEGKNPVKISLQPVKDGEIEIVSKCSRRTTSIKYAGTAGVTDRLLIGPETIEVRGKHPSNYLIRTRLLDERFPHELSVAVRTTNEPFSVNFLGDGSLNFKNLGRETIVFDLKIDKYSKAARDTEKYDELRIDPNDTLRIFPESRKHIKGGKLIIQVDSGSDGIIDLEEKVNPYSARPIAKASDIYVYADESGYARVKLDGSASFSPLGKSLSWYWKGNFLEGPMVEGKMPIVTMPEGTWIVELTVNDGELDSLPITIYVHVLPQNATLSEEEMEKESIIHTAKPTPKERTPGVPGFEALPALIAIVGVCIARIVRCKKRR